MPVANWCQWWHNYKWLGHTEDQSVHTFPLPQTAIFKKQTNQTDTIDNNMFATITKLFCK